MNSNLLELIGGGARIKLELTGEDLLKFSEDLIEKAAKIAAVNDAPKEEKLLTRGEVRDICGVCNATLWHWHKRKYLVPIKVGSKVRYKQSDVEKILGDVSIKSVGNL